MNISIGHHPPGDPDTITWEVIDGQTTFQSVPWGAYETGITIGSGGGGPTVHAILDITGFATSQNAEYFEYVYNSIAESFEGNEVVTNITVADSDGNVVWELENIALAELCDNSMDDDLDGYADCADDDCHLPDPDPEVNINCLGSDQTSQYCFDNPGDCEDNGGNVYYCSDGENGATGEYTHNRNGCFAVGSYPRCSCDTTYGGNECGASFVDENAAECMDYAMNDCGGGYGYHYDSIENGEEYRTTNLCCEDGEYAVYDEFADVWRCQPSEPCYPAPKECDYDYDTEFDQWIQAIFYGDQYDWCLKPSKGKACCQVIKFGQQKYYSNVDGNVKIY